MDKNKFNKIKYELYNYECIYLQEPLECYMALSSEGITQNEIIKVYNELTGEDYPLILENDVIDLTKKYNKEAIQEWKKWNLKNNHNTSHKKFKIGDKIFFISGNYNNIKYKSEILGINKDEIYILWDCYWSPIKDNKETNIVIIN